MSELRFPQEAVRSVQTWQQKFLRAIPPVNNILATATAQRLLKMHQRDLVTGAVAAVLVSLRQEVLAAADPAGVYAYADARGAGAAAALAGSLAPRLRRVLNATGVVLHTNLGRSPLAPEAVAQISAVAAGYANLELDLASGERGERYSHVTDLLCRLTGAESALVVNNNAGAVLLMLAALCRDRQVVVSRGELVEIGGSFRVPDVMEQSGARLVEVGTTNKTHLRDYVRAIAPETGALLKVHTSNYRIVGFTESVGIDRLAAVAHEHSLPLLVDWGSGIMIGLERFGLEHEPLPSELLAAGADLVTFSGDKLLGGPQGGFLVGRRELIDRCKRHPLTRALRIDKLTLAGIEATLKLYLEPDRAVARIPTLHMLSLRREDVRPLAEDLAARIRAAVGEGAAVAVIEGASAAGGGSLPGVELPTALVAVSQTAQPLVAVEAALRLGEPAVLARIAKNALLLDPRTLTPEELPLVARAVAAALAVG